MKKIIVVTWCTDDWRQLNTLENLEKSFKYFHPNIDFYVFNTQDTIEEVKKYPWLTKNWMNPVSFLRFIDNYDMFVHLDGDTIITGNLDDLFNSNEDIIGVRNMNNFGNAGAHNWVNLCKWEICKSLRCNF
jgi:lipopolysaccharide biosynthesis glycosyltransferase